MVGVQRPLGTEGWQKVISVSLWCSAPVLRILSFSHALNITLMRITFVVVVAYVQNHCAVTTKSSFLSRDGRSRLVWYYVHLA